MKKPRRWKVNLLSGRSVALGLLGVLFLTGSIAGCLAAGHLDAEDHGMLLERLEGYLALLRSGAGGPFLPVLWRTVRVPLAAFLLGLTAMGLIGLPVLFTVRGFCLAYAVAVFYRLMGLRGLALGACLFGLSALVWLPALLELGVTGFAGSYGLLRRVTGDSRYPLPAGGGKYWLRCGFCAGALLVCVGLEYALVPALIRMNL